MTSGTTDPGSNPGNGAPDTQGPGSGNGGTPSGENSGNGGPGGSADKGSGGGPAGSTNGGTTGGPSGDGGGDPSKDPSGGDKKSRKKGKEAQKEKIRESTGLHRTAKEVKRHAVLTRALALLIGLLVALVAVTYIISYFYDKFGSFTVKVNKYDMARQGLTLSETPEYEHTVSELNANIVYDMTNISGLDLPANLDKINGSHNGENYIAYTFYLINGGRDTISYEGELIIENVTKNVDDAIRVAVYKNGVKTVYGKTKSNGAGKESDCDEEFLASTIVMRTRGEAFAPKERDKYTIVIWLEGNDPDCVDAIIGGTIKFEMDFTIMETT